MSVKRINWEKFDKVQENTVWAKVSMVWPYCLHYKQWSPSNMLRFHSSKNFLSLQIGDSEELDDIVKYLELEQQFSTKKTKVCEYRSTSPLSSNTYFESMAFSWPQCSAV